MRKKLSTALLECFYNYFYYSRNACTNQEFFAFFSSLCNFISSYFNDYKNYSRIESLNI